MALENEQSCNCKRVDGKIPLRKFNCRLCNKEVETIYNFKLYCDDYCKRKFYAKRDEERRTQDRIDQIKRIKEGVYKGKLCYDSETDTIYVAKYCSKEILSKSSIFGL